MHEGQNAEDYYERVQYTKRRKSACAPINTPSDRNLEPQKETPFGPKLGIWKPCPQ